MPVTMAAFAPDAPAHEVAVCFTYWPYWLWVVVMVASQFVFLLVPVKVTMQRPVSHRWLLWPLAVGGFMMGALVVGALFSGLEFIFRDKGPGDWVYWSSGFAGVAIWGVWTIVFFKATHETEPAGVMLQQCRLLLRGSILELLVAVPTHIVARYRNYCCAGVMTFVGLTLGISVMLFSFGPAVFFLYAERWKRLQPKISPASTVHSPQS